MAINSRKHQIMIAYSSKAWTLVSHDIVNDKITNVEDFKPKSANGIITMLKGLNNILPPIKSAA